MSSSHDSEPAVATEDVLRSDIAGSRTARGGLIRGAGYGLGVVAAFGTSVLLLRHLGPADYGKYGAVVALMGLVLGITDGGMTAIGTRELSVLGRGPERERLASSLMTLRALAAAAGVVVAVAFAAVAYDPILTLGAALVGLAVILQSSQAMATVPLLAELRAAPIAGFDLLRQVLTLLGVFALVVTGAELVPFFALQIPIVAILLLTTMLFVRRTFALGFSFHRPHLGRLIRQTLPMSVAVVLNSLYLGTMVVLVSLLSSDRDTGIYAAPARIMDVLVFFAATMISMAIPVLAVSGAEDRERFRNGLQILLQTGLVAALFITVGLIAAAPALMPLIGGAEFDQSSIVLQVLAVALVGIFANQALQFALVTLHAQRRLIYANAVALLILLAAGVALVPTLGPVGGALAVIIGETVLCLGLVAALWHTDQSAVPHGRFLPRAAMATAVATTPFLLSLSPWLTAALCMTIFAIAAVLLKALPREALKALGPGSLRGAS